MKSSFILENNIFEHFSYVASCFVVAAAAIERMYTKKITLENTSSKLALVFLLLLIYFSCFVFVLLLHRFLVLVLCYVIKPHNQNETCMQTHILDYKHIHILQKKAYAAFVKPKIILGIASMKI